MKELGAVSWENPKNKQQIENPKNMVCNIKEDGEISPESAEKAGGW